MAPVLAFLGCLVYLLPVIDASEWHGVKALVNFQNGVCGGSKFRIQRNPFNEHDTLLEWETC